MGRDTTQPVAPASIAGRKEISAWRPLFSTAVGRGRRVGVTHPDAALSGGRRRMPLAEVPVLGGFLVKFFNLCHA